MAIELSVLMVKPPKQLVAFQASLLATKEGHAHLAHEHCLERLRDLVRSKALVGRTSEVFEHEKSCQTQPGPGLNPKRLGQAI